LFGGVAAAIIVSGDDDDDDDGSDAAVAAATATRTAQPTTTRTSVPTAATPTTAPTIVAGERVAGGFYLAEITPGLVDEYDLRTEAGLVVVEVEPDSDAAFAEIEPGDVLLDDDGDPIGAIDDLPFDEDDAGLVALDLRRGSRDLQVFLPLTAGLDGFDDLAAAAQDEVRALITNGTPVNQVSLYIDRIQSQNAVTGNVVSITAGQLVVDTKSIQGEVTFAIDGDTAFYAPTGAGPGSQPAATIDDIKVGDLVFVVSMDGETADSVSSLGAITP
jgi:hypothetical protein